MGCRRQRRPLIPLKAEQKGNVLLRLFRIIVIGSIGLLSSCALFTANTGNGTVPFKVLASGEHSGVYDPYFTTIRSQRALNEIWKRATARQYPSPGTPRVDFSRYTVIALFLGERQGAQYGINLSGIQRTAQGVTVIVREQGPGDTCDATGALKQPFEIVRVAIANKAIKFQQQVVTKHCD